MLNYSVAELRVIGNANITGWGIGTDNESLDAEIE